MTLEINEIGISMRVRSDLASSADAPPDTDAADGMPAKAATERDELVELCVRRVLRALRTSQER